MDGLTILLCITLTIPLCILMLRSHGRKNLPPGPPGLLFAAKILLLRGPVYHFGSILRSLHARYGPVISVRLGTTFVFVADRRLAHSALIKGGGNFDSRPPPSEMFELFLGGSMAASPLGAYFRLVRRNLHLQALHPSRVRLFAPDRQRVCDALVGSLRRDGDAAASASQGGIVTLRLLLAHCLFDLLACMCFGATLGQEALGELLQIQLQISDAVSRFPAFEGIFLYDMARRLVRKRWEALRRRHIQLMLPLIRAPRGGGGEGGHRCYADSLLELRVPEEGDRPLTDEEMVSLCTEFMIASMDTSLALLEWIMADLVNHPDVQAKVYEEVRGRPELTDDELRGSGMPYLKAIVMEGLRLHPVAHLVFPHVVSSDAEVGGYTVTKGNHINFLIGDLGLDETAWTAAREYRPERFLDDHDVDITGTKEIKMAPFGAGRRMCPGYVLATLHAEYFIGSLVREFEWLPPAQDTVDMTQELAVAINMKNPLRARIIPRA